MSAEDIFYRHVEGVGTKQSILNAMNDYAGDNRKALIMAIHNIKYYREQIAYHKQQKTHWKTYYNTSNQMELIRKIIPFEEYEKEKRW